MGATTSRGPPAPTKSPADSTYFTGCQARDVDVDPAALLRSYQPIYKSYLDILATEAQEPNAFDVTTATGWHVAGGVAFKPQGVTKILQSLAEAGHLHSDARIVFDVEPIALPPAFRQDVCLHGYKAGQSSPPIQPPLRVPISLKSERFVEGYGIFGTTEQHITLLPDDLEITFSKCVRS